MTHYNYNCWSSLGPIGKQVLWERNRRTQLKKDDGQGISIKRSMNHR
jgi:hypothetical protein